MSSSRAWGAAVRRKASWWGGVAAGVAQPFRAVSAAIGRPEGLRYTRPPVILKRALRTSCRLVVLVMAAMLLLPRDGAPYSVLAHESNVDVLWDSNIRPLLVHRFPHATAEE